MKDIGLEIYCRDCGETILVPDIYSDEAEISKCPKCGHHDLFRSHYIICDCGAIVYLTNHYMNECMECGRYYNGSGQELSPPETWEEDY